MARTGRPGIVSSWRRLSLAKKVVALAFAGSAVAVSSFAVLAIWSLNQSTQRTLQERLVLATAAAESVDHYNSTVLEQLSRIGDSLAPYLARPSDENGLQSVLIKGESNTGFLYDNLVVADASGRIVGVYPGSKPPIGSAVASFGHSEIALTSRLAYVSGMVPSTIDGSPSVVYAVPLFADGQLVGVLAGEMNLQSSAIGGFISAIKLGRTGYAQVVDSMGELLASTQPEQVFGKSDHGDRFVELIEGRKSVMRTCHSCHEPDVAGGLTRRKDVMAFAPLSTASWGVAVRQSEDEALEQTRKLQRGMLIVGAIALGVAFPGSIAIASRAVRPVLSLTEASKRMAGGDLLTAIPSMGEDEIGVLAENLEHMRKSLNESQLELEKRRREAESLYDIGLEISSLLETDRILGSVVGEARNLLGADLAILMIQNEEGRLYARATSGNTTETVKNLSLANGQGFAGAVVGRGYPLSTEDYLNDPSFAHEKNSDSVVTQEGLRSIAGVPLKIGSEVMGSLVVARRRPQKFSKQETVLLGRLGNQASIAINNAILYEEVRTKEELRGHLLEKVISAQEEERKRIARELHDEPAQIFSALVMQLDAMGNDLPASEASAKERLRRLQGLAANALETVRKIMSDLRPTALDDLGLIPAIRQYAEGKLGVIGVKVNIRTSNMGPRLPGHIETAIFRVLQEAINNVYKHSGASNVGIQMACNGNGFKATVRDDGKGFDVERTSHNRAEGGLGLLGIRERVGLLGGVLVIKSQQGKGTELRIEVPLPGGVSSND